MNFIAVFQDTDDRKLVLALTEEEIHQHPNELIKSIAVPDEIYEQLREVLNPDDPESDTDLNSEVEGLPVWVRGKELFLSETQPEDGYQKFNGTLKDYSNEIEMIWWNSPPRQYFPPEKIIPRYFQNGGWFVDNVLILSGQFGFVYQIDDRLTPKECRKIFRQINQERQVYSRVRVLVPKLGHGLYNFVPYSEEIEKQIQDYMLSLHGMSIVDSIFDGLHIGNFE